MASAEYYRKNCDVIKAKNLKRYYDNPEVVRRYRTSEKGRKRARAHSRAFRQKNKALLIRYKRRYGCVDCREKDPVVLQFDHRDEHVKGRKINPSMTRRILRETLAKCNIRCANCHARHTHQQWRMGII